MRIFTVLMLLLSGGLLFSTSAKANTPDCPPGIDAAHWILLSNSIGIVLTSGNDETHTSNRSPRDFTSPN